MPNPGFVSFPNGKTMLTDTTVSNVPPAKEVEEKTSQPLYRVKEYDGNIRCISLATYVLQKPEYSIESIFLKNTIIIFYCS